MFSGLEHAIVQFMDQYGYVAFFVILCLETAFIIHFVPGELIVSVAAAHLATSPLSLGVVVLVGTVAATMGCMLLYWIVRYGGTRWIERHAGRHKKWLDKIQRTFERPSGEAMVFVFRFLPVVRAPITFPAALARMDQRKFVAYSAAGNFVFVFVIAYLTYVARGSDVIRQWIATAGAFVGAHVAAIATIASATALLAWWVWSERHAIREAPHHVVARAWAGAATLAIATGLVLVGAALVFPDATHRLVSLVLEDYTAWAAARGLSDLVTLLLIASQLLGVGVVALAVTSLVRGLAGSLRRRRGQEGGP